MKTIFKHTTTFILTLILAAAAFAAPAENLSVLEFQVSEAFNLKNSNANRIPPAVLDPNFRAWQPPSPVTVMPCNINDIMMTDGKTICYNPNITSQIPPKVIAFFLAHEYGHIYRQTSNEVAADQFAAQTYAQVDMGVVYAAIWHMANIQPNSCDATHPCGWQRAYIIGEAAGLSRAQTESVIRGEF